MTKLERAAKEHPCKVGMNWGKSGRFFPLKQNKENEGEIDNLLQKWDELIKLQSQVVEIDLSIAVGHALGEGKEIDRIIKEADKFMYQKKKQQKYYK